MIIDGKAIAERIEQDLQQQVANLKGRHPCLAVVLVGDNPASSIYVNRKTKACKRVGIRSVMKEFPSSITEPELLQEIQFLNNDPTIDGILVQLPLPSHLDSTTITLAIDPSKDVDGFHPLNMGSLMRGDSLGFIPCTPLGIIKLLKSSSIALAGKHAVVVGRSNIVGKPIASLLLQENATVTIVHSKSTNFNEICKQADILIVAVGKPRFISKEHVKEGAVVIDVGINKIEDKNKKSGYAVVGDVDFDSVAPICSAITPVPGGVGPMTIASLLQNTFDSYRRRNQS